jgi:hypothetical protein
MWFQFILCIFCPHKLLIRISKKDKWISKKDKWISKKDKWISKKDNKYPKNIQKG